ncbi:cytochrome-c oxidase, cbb3-type subunit III [Uliginosibacterium sp. H1]|uniref:cytochrome-c oxidase, cbb3-type subunit III n=1 Tax=Uliginosibacterium sp. H1 TaxID=3114757 RepID=UPI002E184A76|nr:cytochrome-c oxidase, cbb3-type subunit III [Uliginosibacterium sp. H1]
MSDFVSEFWHYYVAGLTILSLLYCAWVLASNMTRRKAGPVELHGHVWDEDLQEYNNPLPRWWLYLFWLTLIFSLGYFLLYPALGTSAGRLGWTSKGEYEAEMARAAERYDPIFDKYLKQDLQAVAADPEAQAMGQRLFLTYCAQCHGADARGSRGFPNLADGDWLHGGTPEAIKTTITQGRTGVMPPLGAALGGEGTKDVANYVRSLSGLAHDSLRAQRGRELFAQNCVACHGADGKGNVALGAPNLSDRTWLYGSSEAVIIETISKGRQNQMPAFHDLLGDSKVHLLSAYVLSLSRQQ